VRGLSCKRTYAYHLKVYISEEQFLSEDLEMSKNYFLKGQRATRQWFTPAIPATQEAEIIV
jgi:hypothetical protein